MEKLLIAQLLLDLDISKLRNERKSSKVKTELRKSLIVIL